MIDTMPCAIAGCAGPVESGQWRTPLCARHTANRQAPPMAVYCECATPDRQRVYGVAWQCRRCGSPMLETLAR